MNTATLALFAFGLALMIGLCAIVFVLWSVWSFCWHLYDSYLQQYKRIKNNRLDAAYRTKQFYVPYAQKDFK